MSTAVAGVGTVFQRWGGAAWANFAEVTSITGPTMTRDFIDVTSLDSTGGYREYITGFRDAGTISMNMNFTRDSYDLLKTDFESSTLQNYQIILSDVENSAIEFEGLVTEIPITIPTDDKISVDCTIKITGAVTISSGGSTGV
jgi:predicted secreted protein